MYWTRKLEVDEPWAGTLCSVELSDSSDEGLGPCDPFLCFANWDGNAAWIPVSRLPELTQLIRDLSQERETWLAARKQTSLQAWEEFLSK